MGRFIMVLATAVFLTAPALAAGEMTGVDQGALRAACGKLAERININTLRIVGAAETMATGERIARETAEKNKDKKKGLGTLFAQMSDDTTLEDASRDLEDAVRRLGQLASSYRFLGCAEVLK